MIIGPRAAWECCPNHPHVITLPQHHLQSVNKSRIFTTYRPIDKVCDTRYGPKKKFIEKLSQVISMNLTQFRRSYNIYIGDGSDHGMDVFVTHVKAWHYTIPEYLRGRYHAYFSRIHHPGSINFYGWYLWWHHSTVFSPLHGIQIHSYGLADKEKFQGLWKIQHILESQTESTKKNISFSFRFIYSSLQKMAPGKV